MANTMGPVTAGGIDSTAGRWQWVKEGMLHRLHSCRWHSQCPTCRDRTSRYLARRPEVAVVLSPPVCAGELNEVRVGSASDLPTLDSRGR